MDLLLHTAHHLDFSRMGERTATDLGGCRIYTGHHGKPGGPALVFVHGGYHGAWCFSHYLDYFAQRRIGCYALDLPGHGALAAGMRPDMGVEFLAARLVECVAKLARPVVLVGHSVGAIPVMRAAMDLDLHGLVLMAPSPPGNLPGARALPMVPADKLRAAPSPAEVRRRFLDVADDVCVDSVMALMCPESPAVLNDRYALRIHIDPGRIACPGVCFEAGRDDEDRHPEGQNLAIARFLSIDYALLDSQPHCMMYGPQWQESAQALCAWYRHHLDVKQ
ncbi:MAG: alpha/beta hydrolase [Pusillimonas sp.]